MLLGGGFEAVIFEEANLCWDVEERLVSQYNNVGIST